MDSGWPVLNEAQASSAWLTATTRPSGQLTGVVPWKA